jgi:hypothetical protein
MLSVASQWRYQVPGGIVPLATMTLGMGMSMLTALEGMTYSEAFHLCIVTGMYILFQIICTSGGEKMNECFLTYVFPCLDMHQRNDHRIRQFDASDEFGKSRCFALCYFGLQCPGRPFRTSQELFRILLPAETNPTRGIDCQEEAQQIKTTFWSGVLELVLGPETEIVRLAC